MLRWNVKEPGGVIRHEHGVSHDRYRGRHCDATAGPTKTPSIKSPNFLNGSSTSRSKVTTRSTNLCSHRGENARCFRH
ncbi:hypothetical protein PC129_g20833 [Phytophthora cactorum]|uniref:Uncharacterized protein n=1 Tax=Phytophthora cactorum TaxID=29920 RepID=A0A8T1B5Y2_9STRA|nr:hypothetical protein PC114_g23888 [Phytophthora cactorum]KAG2893715.1 hypothetical protein PC117_g23703 [Phytophthora cactorum]KAG3208140.1 hypothetical protein PC129_g20833 [Phytophthora cactorum]